MAYGMGFQPIFTPTGDISLFMGSTPKGDPIPYHGTSVRGDVVPPEFMRSGPKGDAIPFLGSTAVGDVIPYPIPPGGNPFSLQQPRNYAAEAYAASQPRLPVAELKFTEAKLDDDFLKQVEKLRKASSHILQGETIHNTEDEKIEYKHDDLYNKVFRNATSYDEDYQFFKALQKPVKEDLFDTGEYALLEDDDLIDKILDGKVSKPIENEQIETFLNKTKDDIFFKELIISLNLEPNPSSADLEWSALMDEIKDI